MTTVKKSGPDFAPGSSLVFRFWKTPKVWQDAALTVEKRLASGGQADVYVVTDDTGNRWCMKYLFGNFATDKEKFYQKVRLMAKFPSPSPQLAWPMAFSPTASSSGAFYYLMPLFEGYSDVSRIISYLKRCNGQPGAVSPNSPAFRPAKKLQDPNDPAGMTLAQRAEVAAGIAEAVKAIHETPAGQPGYVYGDVSGKNFLYKISHGHAEVKVIDMDNLIPAGGTHQANLGMIGTAQYPAPEVILGTSVPTIHSDLHALGVLVFRILLGSHPLDGALTHSMEQTPENVKRYYGEQPEFTISSKANHASKAVLESWQQLPQVMQVYFSLLFSPEVLKSGPLAPGAKEPRPTAATLRACIRKGFGL